MEMGNTLALEEKVTVRGVNAVSLPPFSFEVPVQRRKLASSEQGQMAEGRSAVSAGSSQGCSSAPPCFPACPRTVSRL